MTDPDLQKLIDAKKEVDQKAVESAENRRIASIAAQEAKAQASADWRDLLTIANEEAGRINSITEQTGIRIAGLQALGRDPATLSYRFTREKTALQIDLIFTRQVHVVEVKVTPTKAVPALQSMQYVKHFPSAKKVDIRATMGDIARRLIEA